ncbi:MAG TPA: CYTH and CHAD domain-containing protein [Nocardioidaceae bacterium]|nr:CYTH and CHAD domain-containing protein [Nocardioidaceae bacterium]
MTTQRTGSVDTYEVDDDAALPPLEGLPGVASVTKPVRRRLESTYFDTPDLALGRRGITLSRTVGGEDPGWRLRMPNAGSSHEVSEPLGRSTKTVPKRLRSLVQAHVRDASLAPVAVVTSRCDVRRLRDARRRLLGEVTEDHVEATPAGAEDGATRTWTEWRFVPAEGDGALRDALVPLLEEAGGTPVDEASRLDRVLEGRVHDGTAPDLPSPRKKGPAAAVVSARLREQVAEVRRLDPLVRSDAPHAVHDMRVALRRLRSALATYRPLLDRDVTDPVRDELRWLAQALGQVRDTEVIRRRLQRLLSEEPSENVQGHVGPELERQMSARYDEARARCLEAMESPQYFALLERLDELATDPPLTPAADEQAQDVLRRAVRRDWSRLRKRVAAVDEVEDAAERSLRLHAVRKAAKRTRYAAEPLRPLYGKDARRFVKAAKRVQTSLGEHHDGTVSQQVLREQADTSSATAGASFTYGILHTREESRIAKARADFEKAWKAASGKRLRGWLV